MTASRWWRPAAVAGLAVTCTLAAACSGPRSGASATSNVSSCAAVLPLASSVVHDQGSLTVVRRISRNDADALSRRLGAAPPAAPSIARPHRPVRSGWPKACLIVYRGNYPPGVIAKASPPAVAGHYALIVLRVRHPRVDRILVTDQPPSNLRL
ncbi:MAG TPA: hypothetical protein VFN75_03300 [Pseudonocardiaceae bacterium]|nr:hypothetical protein [Pseudonocardiaceae bacterium]